MRAKTLNEELNFERGEDPRKTLGLEDRAHARVELNDEAESISSYASLDMMDHFEKYIEENYPHFDDEQKAIVLLNICEDLKFEAENES